MEAISLKKSKPDYGSRKLSAEQIAVITSQEFLVKNKHLALWERVKLIQEEFGVSMSVTTLRSIYKAHKISYVRVQYKYHRKSSPEELHRLKTSFVGELTRALFCRIPVIFYDETSVTL